MYDDLVHLSKLSEKSLIPRIDYNTVRDCSGEKMNETALVGKLFSMKFSDSISAAKLTYSEVKEAWISAILQNPSGYLKFRLNAFLYLLRSPWQSPYYIWHNGIDENEFGLVQKKNVLTVIMEKYVGWSSTLFPFFFKPYWWGIVLLILLISSYLTGKGHNDIKLVRTMMLSGGFYLLGYFFLTPVADFRFVYWTVVSINLAIVIFILHHMQHIERFFNHVGLKSMSKSS
jgi:hypothetical protein